MSLAIRLSGLKQMLKPEGPLFAYLVPWSLVLVGQQLALSKVIVSEYSSMYLVLLGNALTAVFIAFLLQVVSPLRLASLHQLQTDPILPRNITRRIVGFLGIYALIEAVQIVHGRGFPLLWLILKTANQDYATYGIPSLNGFAHALYLFATSVLFLNCLKSKSKPQYALLLCLLVVPIMLISRHLLICIFVQLLCLWLYYRPKAIWWALMTGFTVLGLFVVVGNMRTGLGNMLSVFPPSEGFPEALYGLMWVYAYVVTPFNFLNSNVDYLTPVGWPQLEISAALPSVLRHWLLGGIEVPDTGYRTALPGQVNTFYYEPILDLGLFYGFLFMAVFQLLAICAYRRAVRTGGYLDVLTYSVLYQVMVLSIFHNHLLFQPVIFQLVLLTFLRWKFQPCPTYLKGIPVEARCGVHSS